MEWLCSRCLQLSYAMEKAVKFSGQGAGLVVQETWIIFLALLLTSSVSLARHFPPPPYFLLCFALHG